MVRNKSMISATIISNVYLDVVQMISNATTLSSALRDVKTILNVKAHAVLMIIVHHQVYAQEERQMEITVMQQVNVKVNIALTINAHKKNLS